MSAAMLERMAPAPAGHQTQAPAMTFRGFEPATTIHGFDTASQSVPAIIQKPLQPNMGNELSSSLKSMQQPARLDQPASFQPPTAKSVAEHVGWSGLLEVSRASGASGVIMGTQSVDDETAASKGTKIEVCCTAHTGPAIRRLVKSVIRGLKACQDPEKALEGMGGTYFFRDENGRKAAIMKPCDEEPLAPNNPKGYVGRALGDPGWKPTVRVGEAAMREVAAYLLDHEGFAKVPTSVLVRARHPIFCYNNHMSSVRQSSVDLAGIDAGSEQCTPNALPMKLGSLQEFVSHECDTSEMGPSRFSVRDVHRIGILDIRLFNTDRHAGNMLVRMPRDSSSANLKSRITDSMYELIPIDHGFCLPETLEAPYFEWLHWPQALQPFSEEELAYIAKLDIEADKKLLRQELPTLRPECLRVMEIATTLLKRGAEAGLTLFEIASIMTRPFEGGDEDASDLEKFASYARQAVNEYVDEDDTIAEGTSEDEAGDNVDDGSDSDSACIDDDSSNDQASRAAVGLPEGELKRVMRNASARDGGNGQANNSSRGDETEGMLFELDEVASSGGMSNNRCRSGRLTSHSPGADSIGSSSMSSEDKYSFKMHTSRLGLRGEGEADGSTAASGSVGMASSLGMDGTPRPAMLARGGSISAGGAVIGSATPATPAMPVPISSIATPFAAQQQPAVAASMHLTQGILDRGRRKPAARMRHQLKRGICKTRTPQAYPPVVATFAPESLNGLFSDLDDKQWSQFMAVWGAQVDAALRSGKWRQSLKKDSAVAMSCPRF